MSHRRFKYFMPERIEFSISGQEMLLSVSEYFGVKPRSEAFDEESAKSRAVSLEGYRKVFVGDFVMNYMLAWKGAYGVSEYDGIVSPAYAVYRINPLYADRRFIHHHLRSPHMHSIFKTRSKGIIDSRLRLYPDTFLSMGIDLPNRESQKAIADFLDQETDRIDKVIGKKQRLVELASERIDALVNEAISDPKVPRERFEYYVRQIRRPVILAESDTLVRLGLYNRGRGIFKKPSVEEKDMGDSQFYFVKSGDLIISGQFAWEGAVALASEEEEGCIVSHRFPIYHGINGVKTSYLLGLLRTNYGDFLLNDVSRGSAGRNRPLNTGRLGKEKIPIPAKTLQNAVERAIIFERHLKKKIEKSIMLLNEFRSTLITAAVTGQIDVTNWKKNGDTDRRLDQIEEAIEEA